MSALDPRLRVPVLDCQVRVRHSFSKGLMAALIDAIDVKRKMFFELDGIPYHCLDAEVSTPTARGAQTLVRLKMRNLLTRAVFDKTFKAGDKFKEPDLETVPASFLYADSDGFYFMDQESFETLTLSQEMIGGAIGLQFVVITLIAEIPIVKDVARASSAFSTPTVVHFGAVLLLSAVISAPWHGIGAVAALWGVLGLAGVIYVLIVARHMWVQRAYSPQFEDRLFHVLLPFAAYATLAGSAYATRSNVDGALFGVGAAALLLLFVGIHNAWDAVTYHVFVRRQEQPKTERRQ